MDNVVGETKSHLRVNKVLLSTMQVPVSSQDHPIFRFFMTFLFELLLHLDFYIML